VSLLGKDLATLETEASTMTSVPIYPSGMLPIDIIVKFWPSVVRFVSLVNRKNAKVLAHSDVASYAHDTGVLTIVIKAVRFLALDYETAERWVEAAFNDTLEMEFERIVFVPGRVTREAIEIYPATWQLQEGCDELWPEEEAQARAERADYEARLAAESEAKRAAEAAALEAAAEARRAEAVARSLIKPPGPVVYFVQEIEGSHDEWIGRVKIGFTSRPLKDRIRDLQVGNSRKLVLRALLSGGEVVEAKLHARFDHLRVHGEWFTCAEELLAFMRDLREGRA
jgi:hypothetical protein